MRGWNVAASIGLSSLMWLGCGGDNAHGNGVDDVKLACEQRAGWTKGSSEACFTCMTSAQVSPDCECTKDDYRGACYAQVQAQSTEPQCEASVYACVSECDATDCACRERCFDTIASCKLATAALDGCVADVCQAACE